MSFEEVRRLLKQRFPLIMVDRVLEIEPGKRIKTLKNVTGNEIQFLGHFPDYAIMPGTWIIEAIGQSASILFSSTTGKGLEKDELLVLGIINNMRFFVPVLPGAAMIMEAKIIKMFNQIALIEGIAMVDDQLAAKGKLTFGRMKLS